MVCKEQTCWQLRVMLLKCSWQFYLLYFKPVHLEGRLWVNPHVNFLSPDTMPSTWQVACKYLLNIWILKSISVFCSLYTLQLCDPLHKFLFMKNVQFWVWQHQSPKWSMRAMGKAQVEWDSPEHVSHERPISIRPTHTPRLLVCAHLVVWLARGHNRSSSSSSTLSTWVLRFSLRRRMKGEQNSVSLSDCFWDYAFQMSLLSQAALGDILYRKGP